jgi:hypothetical protein
LYTFGRWYHPYEVLYHEDLVALVRSRNEAHNLIDHLSRDGKGQGMYTSKEEKDDDIVTGHHEILDPEGDVIAVVAPHFVEGLLSHLNR